MMLKDCEVEVTSKEEGFKDSWYRVTLLDNPTKSGRKKLRIRYLTLLEDDDWSPLTETVDQSLIRPVPQENLYKDVVLEEGLVVDAFLKDGWWTGVVVKKIEDENKFLVCFDSPPDVIGFGKNQLRAHFHWTGWKWVGPEFKELDKSMFSPGTMVEVSSVTDKEEVAWFPAMLIKEIIVDNEKKFIVKDFKKYFTYDGDEARQNTTVDALRVRPTPPPFSCEEYTLSDNVEAFRDGFGWRKGCVWAILSEKQYKVCVEGTKDEEEYVYKHSDLRPFKVWKDGVWLDDLKESPVEESLSSDIENNLMQSPIGVKPTTPESVAVDAVLNNKTPIEAMSPVTPALPVAAKLRQANAEMEGQKMSEEDGNSKGTCRKRKREEKHKTALPSDQSPNPEDTITTLPFTKTSPFWKTLDTKEEYKTAPQTPHFRPLLEANEGIREWSAVGMIVTFYGLLEEVKSLKPDVSKTELGRLSSSFAELEKHGFDVSKAQSRISEVLTFKEEREKKEEEKKSLEKKIEDEMTEIDKLEEEIAELQRQERVAKEKKEAAAKRVVEMKARTEVIDKEIGEVELELLVQWYQLYG